MVKKQSYYVRVFEKTVHDFLIKYQLLDKEVCCAISGGVDSMALGFLAGQLYKRGFIKKLYFLHINHQTRKDNKKEKQMVCDLARFFQVEFIYEKIVGLSLKESHFEVQARLKRLGIYKKRKEVIWCAHHLDDSFEWSLKQRFSSSVNRQFWGMPARTPKVVRPFMCVSKEHIFTYAKSVGLTWSEDESNKDPYYERAYLRKYIIPPIKKRYPQYLKHYALSASSSLSQKDAKVKSPQKKMTKHCHHYFLEVGEKVDQKLLEKSIYYFSSVKQGVIKAQLGKVQSMIINGQKGPLSFSGGVELYNIGGHLLLTKKIAPMGNIQKIKKLKEGDLASFLREFSLSLENSLYSSWVVIPSNASLPAYKGKHPLLRDAAHKIGAIGAFKIVSSWKLIKDWRKDPRRKKVFKLLGDCF